MALAVRTFNCNVVNMIRLFEVSQRLRRGRGLQSIVLLFACLAVVPAHAQQAGSKTKPIKVGLISVAKAVVDEDGDGRPDLEGEVVCIRGSVSAELFPAFCGDDREYRLYVQDETAGIRIVSPSAQPLRGLLQGIEGEIVGRIGQYNGTPFLRLDRIVKYRPSAPVVPKQVELEGLDFEEMCGQLVRLSGPLVYEGTRYYLGTDEATRLRLFLRPSKNFVPFIAQVREGLTVAIVGIIEQYDPAPPWQGGYRIRPRKLADLEVLSPFWMMAPARYTAYVLLGGLVIAVAFLTIRWRRAKRQFESPQAQRMRALGTMAGGIAHEFNNYLLAIVGFAELARNELDESSLAQEHLEQVLDASRRAKELIVHILAFGRQKDSELEIIIAGDAIEEGVRLLRAVMPASVIVRSDLGKGEEQIAADRGQLSQLLLNLGTNASYALPEGGDLTVSMESVILGVKQRRELGLSQDRPHLLLEVSDNGVGMDAETLSHIFDPFFTTRGQAEGSGLGLSVVHGIVKRHRGAISVESVRGRGTTFRCYFPIESKLVDSVAELPVPQPVKAVEGVVVIGPIHDGDRDTASRLAASDFQASGRRVMVVDDHTTIISLLNRLLRAQGFEVTVFSDPVAAAMELSRNPDDFDLLITDLTMPRMTGLELARKAHELRPGLPVVLMTGNASNLTDEILKLAGVHVVLDKPFRQQDLLGAMTNALSV